MVQDGMIQVTLRILQHELLHFKPEDVYREPEQKGCAAPSFGPPTCVRRLLPASSSTLPAFSA